MPAEDIKELEFPDTFLHGEYEGDREGILDVRIHLNNERKINIEIQILEYPFWEERSLYYLSKMFIDGFAKGESYSVLEECIHISILGFDLFHADHYFSKIRLMDEKTHTIYSDKLSLRILYLNQLEQVSVEESKEEVYKWAKLISAKDWKVLKDGMGQNEIDRLERDETFKNEMIRTYISNR
ncbi:Rpn family recombination-promoting nuclease/putative transposase [Clostridium sp. MCC353]|nr:Rpn family recombination-promoting nuclease/putative transposase [Clostridium sp. MCC353]